MGRCGGARPMRGLTLVEVVIAITIFAFAVVPLVGLFGRGSTYTQVNADHLAAMHSSSSYLRALMGLPGRDIPLGSPVELNQTFGSDPANSVHIPASAVINGTQFTYRLRTRYDTRDADETDFWFVTMPDPDTTSSLTAYKRYFRLEFEVTWTSKMSGNTERLNLFVYKADLG
ncbi:MAG: hypothetical protein A2W80_00635 [Candidatus Riflebacteria bacterium GWC2_50_8]|nr:MAG: hypothetical protein A2W80_00635 [Candidatus Riflebacteria bacterium GWC2_50_8]